MIIGIIVAVAGMATAGGDIESVLAHPPYASYYMCGEHRQGELKHLGDSLGTDCVVHKLHTENGRTWARAYENDGSKNEYWFGWNAALLSPCDCTVEKIVINPTVNEPGHLGKPPASMIIFKRKDDIKILMAHVQDVIVAEGDQVSSGQQVAKVGNNGFGRMPHIHMGAWKGDSAMQIRWDTSTSSQESE